MGTMIARVRTGLFILYPLFTTIYICLRNEYIKVSISDKTFSRVDGATRFIPSEPYSAVLIYFDHKQFRGFKIGSRFRYSVQICSTFICVSRSCFFYTQQARTFCRNPALQSNTSRNNSEETSYPMETALLLLISTTCFRARTDSIV